MDCSEEQPGSVKNVNEEKKKDLVVRHLALPERVYSAARHMLSSSGKVYPIRLSNVATNASLTSGVLSLLAIWSPLSNAEFSDFAVLFDQYRVVRHELAVWFNGNNEEATAVVLPTVCIVGADPGAHISTATSTNVANLGEVRRWNPASTRLSTASFVTGKPTLNRAPPPNPLTKDGFLPVTDAWGGQTVLYASNILTSTATALYYQQTWDVEFRCRV
jgi:hypothetical protein